MRAKEYLEDILEELHTNSEQISEEQLENLCDLIQNAHHIFLAGAGRSGVVIRGFASRLMHLGYSVSVVGEISSPHSAKGDLVIIASGSGQTESLLAIAKKSKSAGVKIALVTMDAQSAIGVLSDSVVVLPGSSPKLKNAGAQKESFQPMGSAFEQLCFLVFDTIVLKLMERTGQDSKEMFARHADFE